jgi:hypothetical protein
VPNLFIQVSLRAENDGDCQQQRQDYRNGVISMVFRSLESLRRFARVALVASLVVCVLNISDTAGFWIDYTIDGPVSDVMRAKLRQFFIDPSDGITPSDRATPEIKEIRIGSYYFVFIKGGRNCYTDALCLTVVFDQDDSSKIAFLMSNGTFVIPDLQHPRGTYIIFSPRTQNEISLTIMPNVLIVAPPL